MSFILLALNILSPTIARSIANEAQGKDTKQDASPFAVSPDVFAPAFNDDLRINRRAGFVAQIESKQDGRKNGYTHNHLGQTNPTHKGQSGRKNRSRYVVTAPTHIATTIGTWPTRRGVAKQIMVNNGLNPDEYRETQTVNAPGRTSVVFRSYTNDTLLDQYLRSQHTLPGIAGDGSHGLTQLPKLDQQYEKVWADFAATELPEIRRKTTQRIVDLFASSFGVKPKLNTAMVYQLKSGPILSDDKLKVLAGTIGDIGVMAHSSVGTSKSLIPANTGYFVHVPERGQTVAIWEADGALHMESVPRAVFESLKSTRAPNPWINDHIGDFFSGDMREKNGFGESFTIVPISGAVSPLAAAETVATRILDPERLEKAGYEETSFERFVDAAWSALVPYYDAIKKVMKGDVVGASKSVAEEVLYDLLFSVIGRATGKAFGKGVEAIGKSDIGTYRKIVDDTLEELHIPKAEDIGESVNSICKRDVRGCIGKPPAIRSQKHAAKSADRHKLPRPKADPAKWGRGLTTKRVADLFGNGLNPDGSYRLTAEQASAGFDNHLMQIQQEINSALAAFDKLPMPKEEQKAILRWVGKSVLSAAKDSRFNFDQKTLRFGEDMAWLKFKREKNQVIVSSRP